MWQISDIQAEYRRLDGMMGIDTSAIDVEFSPRMIRQYGVCVFVKNRPVKIRIASFLQTENAVFWNTVRHEYAHAAAALMTGHRHGHDTLWKNICRRIGAAPVRQASECAGARQNTVGRKCYIVLCSQCGAKSVYYRRGAVVQALEQGKSCTCRRCGGKKFTLQEAFVSP